MKRVLIGYAKISDFSRIADLEFLQVLNIYEAGDSAPLDVSFLRGNRELLSFGTHMGIAGERVFLYLDKLKEFATGWSGSPDQPHQFSEYTNLDFLMNAVGAREDISRKLWSQRFLETLELSESEAALMSKAIESAI